MSDLALHFLDKMKIMVVKDIEREEIEFICKVLSALSVPASFYLLIFSYSSNLLSLQHLRWSLERIVDCKFTDFPQILEPVSTS